MLMVHMFVRIVSSCTPDLDIVPNTFGSSDTPPAIVPYTTRHADDKLHNKFNCLKCMLSCIAKFCMIKLL